MRAEDHPKHRQTGPAGYVLNRRRPFTRADAVAAGVDPRVLRSSLFRRLFRGVYVGSDVADTDDVLAMAALALHPPGAFASHSTAARLLKVPVPHCATVHVSVRRQEDRRSRPGLRSHLAPPDISITKVRGIPVSSAIDTFIALASMVDLVGLVAAGDSMVALGLVSPDALRAATGRSTCRNAARAHRAAALVRSGVDSQMESRLRVLIVLAGLPEPVVNHVLRRRDGSVRYRLDLSYPEIKLIIEYDGRQHADDAAQWHRDLQRREWLDGNGWRIIVVTARDLYSSPAATLTRIHSALRSRTKHGVATRLRDEWRRYFPAAA